MAIMAKQNTQYRSNTQLEDQNETTKCKKAKLVQIINNN